MVYSQSNIAISNPSFVHRDHSSVSFSTISDYGSNTESILSSFCSPNTATWSQQAGTKEQTPSDYNAKSYAMQYHNGTGQSNVDPFESYLNRTAPTSMDRKSSSINGKAVARDSNSISWRTGKTKKKDTISAGLLIALGVAGGIVMR